MISRTKARALEFLANSNGKSSILMTFKWNLNKLILETMQLVLCEIL